MGAKVIRRASSAAPGRAVSAGAAEYATYDMSDPGLAAFLKGAATQAGKLARAENAIKNMAVWRCVDLISSCIGGLPLYLRRKNREGEIEDAEEHPLFDLLMHSPNNWQSSFEFKGLMQLRVLLFGNAYALLVRSGDKIIRLIPLDPTKVTFKQEWDWSITYTYQKPDGGSVNYSDKEILHLRGLSLDGLSGLNRVELASNALALARDAEQAAMRLFQNGMMVGGILSHPGKIGDKAHNHLVESLNKKYAGVHNAHKWMVVEEGMTVTGAPNNAVDSQQLETRGMQIEEAARAFGVPRPLLMMDDTSWGSGVEQLAILFIRFGLSPWFKVWEGGINRVCLTPLERRRMYADFDEKELLRGTLKDQGEYLAKALGAGGSKPWLSQNEARDHIGAGRSKDEGADSIKPAPTKANPDKPPGSPADPNEGGTTNE